MFGPRGEFDTVCPLGRPDHLSVRAITDGSGNIVEQKGNFPFGENWYSGTNSNKLRFTTYERDAESGNDYAMARYYINRLGRLNSPDPIAGRPAAPQSLNRYAYVRNDPINTTDPGGDSPSDYIDNASIGFAGMDVAQILIIINDLDNRAWWGSLWYDLPGHMDEEALAEAQYSQVVAQGMAHLVEDAAKKRLKKLFDDNPQCAELFGGTDSAIAMVDKMTIVDTSVPGWAPAPSFEPDSLGAGGLAEGHPAYTVFPTYVLGGANTGVWNTNGFYTYVGASFGGFSASAQLTVLIHEMGHPWTSSPVGGAADQPGSEFSYENIHKRCDTEIP